MNRLEKTVFISYRHTNAPWALAIYQHLRDDYDVFFDYTSIPSGDFEQVILANIRGRVHFIVLLTPSALERCDDPKDWLRREIECALENKRNIIPLMLEGFDFNVPAIAKHLTGKLELLRKYNAMTVPVEYFDAAMTRLRDQFLSVPLDYVLHPISDTAQNAVHSQKTAANVAPPVSERYLIAQRWFEKGNLSEDENEKILCLTHAIQLQPNFSEAYNNRGNAYAKLENYPAALADHNHAIELQRDFAEAYNNRGNTYNKIEDYQTALADINRAIELHPNYASAYNNRGITYNKIGDYLVALTDFNRAIELQPDVAKYYNNRGLTYANMKDFPAAQKDYNRAIKLLPDYVDPVYNAACAYALQRQVKSACSLLRQAVQMDSKCFEMAKTDTDFDPIRDTPEFQTLIKQFENQ